jgi:hypothetical protein
MAFVIEQDYSWSSGLAILENADFYDKPALSV